MIIISVWELWKWGSEWCVFQGLPVISWDQQKSMFNVRGNAGYHSRMVTFLSLFIYKKTPTKQAFSAHKHILLLMHKREMKMQDNDKEKIRKSREKEKRREREKKVKRGRKKKEIKIKESCKYRNEQDAPCKSSIPDMENDLCSDSGHD